MVSGSSRLLMVFCEAALSQERKGYCWHGPNFYTFTALMELDELHDWCDDISGERDDSADKAAEITVYGYRRGGSSVGQGRKDPREQGPSSREATH